MFGKTAGVAERSIGATAPYRVLAFGEGVAFLLTDLSSGTERLLAFEEAHLFRCDLRFLSLSHQTPGATQYGMPWEDCVAELAHRYLSDGTASHACKDSTHASR